LEFANQQITDFCTKYGIKQLFASPYHPQTNGLVERTNKTLADTITKISRETNKNWDQCIAEALFAIRTTYQSTTKQTPFYLTYGREARIPIDSQHLDLETPQDTWEKAEQVRLYQLNEVLPQQRNDAQKNIQKKQQTYSNDQIRKVTLFHIGDKVLVYQDYAKNTFSIKLDNK
jgi:transposase InsO family protein